MCGSQDDAQGTPCVHHRPSCQLCRGGAARTRQIGTHDGASVSATEVTAEGNKTRVGVTTQAFDGHFDLHSVLKINNADIALCERRNASFIYSRVPRKSYVSRTFNCGLEDGILRWYQARRQAAKLFRFYRAFRAPPVGRANEIKHIPVVRRLGRRISPTFLQPTCRATTRRKEIRAEISAASFHFV